MLDVVFVISQIIKVEVKLSVISRAKRPKLITLTETLIIPDITKTESNNCFTPHCFEESKGVFERRTSTGSEEFSFLISLDDIKFVLLSFFTLIVTI